MSAVADGRRDRRPATAGLPRNAPVTPDAARLAAALRGPGATPNRNHQENPR
jgi:hypothetical protein